MRWEFSTATRIVFGAGTISELPAQSAAFGKRALIVTGSNQDRAKQHLAPLDSLGISCRYFSVPGEPTVELVREGAAVAHCVDFVVGFGGGSAIDAAKAIAAVSPNSGEPLDYMEVVGRGRALDRTPLPFVAVPTTAGTGAEVTRNAVIGHPERGVKASIRSPLMLARLAIIDANLTLDVPPFITAFTGLDTITQLIEPYVSARANAFADMYCLEGLRRALAALPKAFVNGSDIAAREDMAFASLLSGLSLANAGLGAVHGFAAPLGAMLNAPHGALCAAVLPNATAVNIRALRSRSPQNPALHRYQCLASLLTGDLKAPAESCTPVLSKLCSSLGIASLGALGLAEPAFPDVIERAASASSMKANPIQLTNQELAEILHLSL